MRLPWTSSSPLLAWEFEFPGFSSVERSQAQSQSGSQAIFCLPPFYLEGQEEPEIDGFMFFLDQCDSAEAADLMLRSRAEAINRMRGAFSRPAAPNPLVSISEAPPEFGRLMFEPGEVETPGSLHFSRANFVIGLENPTLSDKIDLGQLARSVAQQIDSKLNLPSAA